MKRTLKKLPAYLYFGCFGALLLSAPAQAYLDPGTVTYVVSMVAALFIAAGAALAIFRRKVVLFFRNLGKKKDPTTVVPEDDSADINPMEDINPMDDKN